MATIKKGTYRLNERMTEFTMSSIIPFSCDGVEYNVFGVGYTDTEPLVSLSYILVNDLIEQLKEVTVYRNINNEYWLDEKYRYITVLNDTDVDEESFNSFVENTTMLIKAGTYRWNDVVDLSFFEEDIPFSFNTETFVINEYTYSLVTTVHIVESGDNYNLLIYDYYDEEGTLIGDVPVYDNVNLWNSSNILAEGLFPEGYGQLITTTEDQYVPTNFGLWAVENWQTYAEGEETATATITYKGEVITLNAGETVTLHTTGKKLTEDLVIKANEVSSGESVDLTEIDTLIGEGV